VNGMSASGFAVDGLRGGRQSGSKALANHWAFVARGDVELTRDLDFGVSIYSGKSGQNQELVHPISGSPVSRSVPGTLTTIYEVHAQYRARGLTLRGLFTQAFVADAAELNFAQSNSPLSSVAKQMLGGYVEVGYDVLPLVFESTKMSLEPFFRYERLDTQHVMPVGALANEKYTQDILTAGVGFHPIDQIVLKFDYRHIRPRSDPDDVGDQIQASVGYVF